MADTFTEAVQLQTTIMLKIAKRLDEKGYAVMLHMNTGAENETYIYGYLSGAVQHFLTEWAERKWGAGPLNKRRKAVLVHICVNVPEALKSGRPLDHITAVRVDIPNRKHYRPINAALELMSATRKHWRHWRSGGGVGGHGVLERSVGGNIIEYRGATKDALEILLRVLDMPTHREILCAC